jgi:PAS domain S-box-containing protein
MSAMIEMVPEVMQIFFNLSSELLCIRDRKGDFLTLNPTWQKVLGWNPEELRSHSWHDLIHPDDLHQTLMKESAVNMGQVCHLENRYRHKNGAYCWLSWRILYQENGLTYAVARLIQKKSNEADWRVIAEIFTDNRVGISPQKLPQLGEETELQEEFKALKDPLNRNESASWIKAPTSLNPPDNSLRFFQEHPFEGEGTGLDPLHPSSSPVFSELEEGRGFGSLDERSSSPLAIAQLEERLLKVNATLCEMLGDTQTPFPADSLSELSPSETLDTSWHKLQEICGSPLRWVDPKTRERSNSLDSPRRGESRCAIAPLPPVQDRRCLSEITAWALLNATTESLCLLDPEGIILASNPMARQRLGIEQIDGIGRCIYEHLPNWVATVRRNYIKQVLDTGKPVRFQEVRHPAHFDVSIYPALDSRGKVTHLAVFEGDRSDLTQPSATPAQINAQLERRVMERTAELQAANQELEAFCYSVSHDLRSPLRAIGGFAQAVLEDYQTVLDSTGKDYLQRVCAATQRMNQLIDDLMSLSRVTRTQMQRKPVNLSQMVRAIASELQGTQPDRQIRFKIADHLMADGDPHLLQVMLTNLLGNAWKFTNKTANACVEFGVSHLPVPTESEDVPGSGQAPVYFVRDNGAGFNMTYSDKLFAPFQRLHKTSDFEGTGIGLATVSRIVQRHGGQVWAIAEVNRGATFYFTL